MNIKISKEVKKALKKGEPVIALESTIISFGMPYPQNVETALNVEKVIRDNGAIPATIGIINGEPIIGLTKEEIEYLAHSKKVRKCSRRDLPIILGTNLDGATTVSGTMILAHLAGIEFFVTGGIGGAHKKANLSFDISADLEELAKTNVSVICAGPKAILDLGLTMEILETKGVPVIGYKTDYLPAFYTSTSEFKVDYNAKNPLEIAKIIKAKRDYKLDGGVLITNPINKKDSLDPEVINKVINEAILDMEKEGIHGKDETPYLLSKIGELTKGDSLEANIKLILSNAKLGSKIAIEYKKLNEED